MLDGGIVHLGSLAVDIVLKAVHGLGVLFGPCVNLLFALGDNSALLGCTLCIQLGHLGKYHPGILGITAQVLDGLAVVGTRLAQRVTVGAAFALEVLTFGGDAAAAHDGAADDDGGALGLGDGLVQGVGQGDGIGTVTLDDVPVPGAVFHGCILVAHGVTVGGQLHCVAVIEHDQVVEPQVAGNAGCLL